MLNSILGTELTLTSFLICTGVSLLLGVGTALVAGYRSRSAQSLAVLACNDHCPLHPFSTVSTEYTCDKAEQKSDT